MSDRLYVCAFGTDRAREWRRLFETLRATAATHCATWDRTFDWCAPAPVQARTGVEAHAHNTIKLDAWAQFLARCDDGDRVLLLDADTVILEPIDDIWARAFDLAYTVKPQGFPFNLGVIFLRVSPATRVFMDRWRAKNAELAAMTYEQARTWRRQFGGINQAAFGLLRDAGALRGLALEMLPCATWNCEETGWQVFASAPPRILHIKGALRRSLFRGEQPPKALRPALQAWLALEQASQASQVAQV